MVWAPGMIRIGLDLGARRVGVSLHEEDDVPARAHDTLDVPADGSLVRALAAVVEATKAAEVIVGLPLNMDGSEGLAARNARRVAKALGLRVKAAVVLWDERLTTTQAQRARRERGVKGREGIDAEAATILLQSYVDAQRGGSAWEPDVP